MKMEKKKEMGKTTHHKGEEEKNHSDISKLRT